MEEGRVHSITGKGKTLVSILSNGNFQSGKIIAKQ
jgi:hypothetical protein